MTFTTLVNFIVRRFDFHLAIWVTEEEICLVKETYFIERLLATYILEHCSELPNC